MAIGVSIENKNGVFYLSGMIDETARFDVLRDARPPLRLNLRGVRGINSLGIRNFLVFLQSFAQPFEYHECPMCFVDMINVIPEALGKPPKPERVRSFMLPFVCDHCQEPVERLIKFDSLQVTGEEVVIPDFPCDQCAAPMELDGDQDDYFLFITCPG